MEQILAELRSMRVEMNARFDGLYVTMEILRRDTRNARTAINDFARENVTPGEVETIHEDLDRIQTELLQINARLATVEQK